jgi:hypothetical protein
MMVTTVQRSTAIAQQRIYEGKTMGVQFVHHTPGDIRFFADEDLKLSAAQAEQVA